MSLAKIKMLLQENIGLHSNTIGDSSIERAIHQRMSALKINDAEDYHARLLDDQDEQKELIEEVVVPETWFFRNRVPFEAMIKCFPALGVNRNTDKSPVRILSIPCSTGEEPYSIAISLLKSGMMEDSFQIDAVDISKKALKKARRAIYGKNSFRETNGVADQGYFKATKSGQQVLPHVKKYVNFIEGNILKDAIAPEPEYYDIIFCRNLLIYFNRETQKNVLEKINTILKKNGILFMGHAETVESAKELFARVNIPRAFAFKKKINKSLVEFENYPNQTIDALEGIYNKLIGITLKDIELSKKHKNSQFKTSRVKSKKNPGLSIINSSNIERLIEQGHLTAASTLCEKWLEENPEKAQGYYLLGLICNLEGNIGSADALLKKAIYLDPNHHKALGLSAMLAESRGEETIAETLRFRESRAKKRIQ